MCTDIRKGSIIANGEREVEETGLKLHPKLVSDQTAPGVHLSHLQSFWLLPLGATKPEMSFPALCNPGEGGSGQRNTTCRGHLPTLPTPGSPTQSPQKRWCTRMGCGRAPSSRNHSNKLLRLLFQATASLTKQMQS